MQPLLHSPILQALGYAIINSLWQFALLWLLYFFINTIFKLSTHQKYTTGIVLELAGFVWFVETVHFYYGQSLLVLQNHLVDHRLYFPALTATAGTFKQQFFLLVLRTEQFFPYLSVAYLTLLIILTFRWLYAYTYTRQVRNKGLVQMDKDWTDFVQDLSVQLGIKRNVQIFLSEVVQTPLTVGFLKPLILVPVATVNYLTPQQLEAVLLHEIAHIKRCDYLFNLVLALIEAALFFNPFMQLLHQQIKKERENCCDDWVIKYNYNPASYARALLEIASRQRVAPLLALNATDGKQVLITRIKRIIEKNESTFFNYKHQLLALLVMTIVLSSLSFLSPAKKGPVSASMPVQSNIIFEPMAAKVSNPLFNPVFFLATPAGQSIVTKKKEVGAKAGITSKIRVLSSPAIHNEPLAHNEPAAVADVEPIAEVSSLSMNEVDATLKTTENFVAELNSQLQEPRLLKIPKTDVDVLQFRNNNLVIADAHNRRINLDRLKENTIALNRVRVQIKRALNDLKATKQEVDIATVAPSAGGANKIFEKRERINKKINDYNEAKLALLEKKIETAFDSIRMAGLYTMSQNADFSVNLRVPTVVYTIAPSEKKHSYSYEFSTEPRIRVLQPPAPKECPKIKRKIERARLLQDDEEVREEEPEAPADAPPTQRTRSIFVIRI